ncbi:hypothetical protein AB0D12_08715 [Streptomyces sp. NPDC048479]|uniref:hypothetical protein n=1 Tax=Streptomyces sp. NPDC048479 TaxID=3154725 RepID=UPI003421B254
MTVNVGRDAWEAAALRLFDDKYSLVATGPRLHSDWMLDSAAVMNDAEVGIFWSFNAI